MDLLSLSLNIISVIDNFHTLLLKGMKGVEDINLKSAQRYVMTKARDERGLN